MKENSFQKLSQSALTKGYMYKPLTVYNHEDRLRVFKNIEEMFKKQIINDFMLYNVVDRLTYVRDYFVRKSINFMMTVKDRKGETIAFAEMVYSKNSEMLYIKKFQIEKGHNEKEVLSLTIRGAKDHLNDYSMKFNTIITSPQVSNSRKDLDIMMDLGMKFMSFTPKIDYGELNQTKSKTNIPSEKNEIVLFPFKEQVEKKSFGELGDNVKKSSEKETSFIQNVDGRGALLTKEKPPTPKGKVKSTSPIIPKIKEDKIKKEGIDIEKIEVKKSDKIDKLWEEKGKKLEVEKEILHTMHVLLIKKYGNKKDKFSEEKFRIFLDDIKEEETDLTYLFELFKKDSDVKITLRKIDEIEKLLLLFNKWGEEDEEKEEKEEIEGKDKKGKKKGGIDSLISNLLKGFNKETK